MCFLCLAYFFFFLLRKRKFWTREISVCYTFFLNANNIHEMILCDVTFLHIVRRDGIYFVIFKFVFFFLKENLVVLSGHLPAECEQIEKFHVLNKEIKRNSGKKSSHTFSCQLYYILFSHANRFHYKPRINLRMGTVQDILVKLATAIYCVAWIWNA